MRTQRLLVILVIFTALFYMMGIHILKTILPFLAKDIGASGVLIARILYIGFLAFTFFSPIAGYLSDKIGYQKVIASAAICEALLIYLYNIVNDYMQLIILRILQAFFGVLLSASFLHLASTYAKKTGLYIGLLRAAQSLGMALGPLIVLLFAQLSIREFIILASILCLAPISSAFLRTEIVRDKALPISKVSKFILRKSFLPFYLCTLAEVMSVSIIFSYIVVDIIERYNLTPNTYAIIIFCAISAFSIASVFVGRISDRYPEYSATFGVFSMSICILIMLMSNTLFSLILAFIMFEIVSAFAYNPLYIVISKELPEEIKGFGINLADWIINLSFLILPFLELLAAKFGLRAVLLPLIILTTSIGAYSSLQLKGIRVKKQPNL